MKAITLSLSSILSVISLVMSVTVAWLTLFRRGTLHMTQPVLVAFLFEKDKPKIFLRTLLYATGKRGYVIEGLYLKIRQKAAKIRWEEENHTFGFWMYGQRNDLTVAGGLRVTEDGASFNHHFLDINEYSKFDFTGGDYEIAVYARVVNQSEAHLLSTVELTLSIDDGAQLRFNRTTGVMFTWNPDTKTYYPSLSQPKDL